MGINFKTVGGYEVVTDGEDSVKLHRLLACVEEDPHDVFNGRVWNVHHRNTIPWDNRPANLLLLRSRYHRNFHAKNDWIEICDFYNDNDVSEAQLSIEKYYKTISHK
ncbi:HNH endonuclease [Halogranum tailed virus 1]|uniref:HNH nuclease domain-containing protein n=1 Tax=Halogranum tailed virus 1 TaxID=1273749 RepID=R4TGR1_9CAUD|nr:HNH endonuclease [Halogranum tailed virus 1]AGM11426.1 hypothetical protein HGTV1_128 [Halogranum tailed virus 1]